VAAGSQAAAQAGATLLQAGGNAVDAAVAAALAATVAEPGLASLGGGGFLLARTPDGAATVLDFFVDVPGIGAPLDAPAPSIVPVNIAFTDAEQVFYAGPGGMAVPGTLDGLVLAHQRLGRAPLAEVVAPARRLAREGTPAEPMQAAILGLLTEIFALTPESAQVYLPGGRAPMPGQPLANPELADVFDAMAAGQVSRFAHLPGVTTALARLATSPRSLSGADLSRYAPQWREPLVVRRLGAVLRTNPPPSQGGTIVADAVTALDAPVGGTAADAVRVVEALRDATQRAKRRSRSPLAVRGTTHVSVVDADGGIASLTQSNGSCSGVLVPGTGVHLNNIMGEEDLHPAGLFRVLPGTRVGSMMSPSVLHLVDGTVVAFGSGGSERIRSALLAVVLGLVDRGLPVDDAVHAPRLHWDAAGVQAEPPLPAEHVAALRALGPVTVWSAPDLYFGGVHVAARHDDGRVGAVGDPRRGGAAQVVTVA